MRFKGPTVGNIVKTVIYLLTVVAFTLYYGISAVTALLACLHCLDRGTKPSTTASRLVFLKSHYTRSSFIQNIFFRYGDNNDLTFVFPTERHNECNGSPDCISLTNTLRESNILPPPTYKSFDILCSYVIYNRQSFRKHFSTDTRYVSLLFDPKVRAEYVIALQDDVDKKLKQNLALFANYPTKYDHPMLKNRMAFDFGFDNGLFNSTLYLKDSLSADELGLIQDYLSDIVKDFDLIMVSSMMNESLVLLRRLMGWGMEDILYPLRPVPTVARFKSADVPNVRNYLYLDYRLHNRALEEIKEKIKREGPEFYAEVETFKRVNTLVNHFCKCTGCTTERLVVDGTCWNKSFTIDRPFCEQLLMDDNLYLRKLKQKQYRRTRVVPELRRIVS